VRDELVMIHRRPRSPRLRASGRNGIAKEAAEIKALQGVEQPPEFHPEGDV
jgi:hypothetical protein